MSKRLSYTTAFKVQVVDCLNQWSPSLNGLSTAGKHLTHRSSLNYSNAAVYQTRWTDEATQEDEQYDDDDLLFNDEDIMSTEPLK